MLHQQIYKLLKRNATLRVIIQCIDTPINLLTPRLRVTFTTKKRNEFLAYAKEEDENIDQSVSSRIHITGFNIFEDLKDEALLL